MELLEQYYSDSRSKNELIREANPLTLREVAVCRGKRLFGSLLVMPHSPWSNARSHISNQVPQHRPCNLQTILDTDPEMLVYHRP